MSEDLIRYDILTQDALRGVVRKVLTEVAQTGLPGEHHFYISFETTAPGVRISTRLLEKYPKDITIVVQHEFWDLKVTEHSFEIGLSFGGIPERLLVPFSALRGFVDPSVQFGLQFAASDSPEESTGKDEAGKDDSKEGTAAPLPLVATAVKTDDVPEPAETVTASENDDEADQTNEKPREADVVSLDAFRKK